MSDYDFRDLNIYAGTEDTTYPSEAMIFNGTLIEQAIPEYRTLQVTGRELLGQSLTTIKVGNQDGQRLQQHSRPEREITVKYHIKATSNSRYREIFYQLNSILSGSEHKISFLDQPDIYFIGTLEDADIPDGGSNEIVSTFTIYCADPYAHSTTEDKFTFSDTATTQIIVSDLANKVAGNLTVPHTIYQGYEGISVAMAAPSAYKTEITQPLYAQLNSRNGGSAKLASQAKETFGTGITADDILNGEPGFVDGVSFDGDTFTIGGWYATNESANKPYRFIILTDDNWQNEYGRVKVEASPRPDIGRYYPNVANSKMAGFLGTFNFEERMSHKRIQVHLRYSDAENGEGNWTDYTASIQVNSDWRQTAPHYLIKVDVLQAIETKQPGFWNKLNLTDRGTQREWIKSNLVSTKVESYAYGHSPQSNNAAMQIWDNDKSWVGAQKVTGDTPMQMQYNYATADEFIKYVDSNGYLYVNIFPEYTMSTSAGDSVICLDYFDFQIKVEQPVTNSLEITNNGPLPTPIRFDFVNNGQNGFLGISNNHNESILIGSREQTDTTEKKQSETLFKLNTAKYDITDFLLNGGTVGPNEYSSLTGTFDLIGQVDNGMWAARNMAASSWGKGLENGRGWHGPTLHRDFGADSNGTVGADNFFNHNYLTFRGNIEQWGLESVTLQGAAGEHLVTAQLDSGSGGNGSLSVFVGTDSKRIYVDENNPRWNNFRGKIDITRSGNVYTVVVEDVESGTGVRQTVTYTDPVSAKIKATGWTYWKAIWGDSSKWVSMDPHDMSFRKDNVDKIIDVPNTFAGGDKISITCDDGKVVTKKNGGLFLTMQDIGSKPILAYPGKTIVSFMYSQFANRPNVTAYIRQKYL